MHSFLASLEFSLMHQLWKIMKLRLDLALHSLINSCFEKHFWVDLSMNSNLPPMTLNSLLEKPYQVYLQGIFSQPTSSSVNPRSKLKVAKKKKTVYTSWWPVGQGSANWVRLTDVHRTHFGSNIREPFFLTLIWSVKLSVCTQLTELN